MSENQNLQGIFEFVQTEITAYKALPVHLDDQWEWNMYEHIRRSFLLKNSKFYKGSNEDGLRPFKNIILPILNVAYRSEGFDVKDILPFVDDIKNYYKSFLIKKFHPKWARKNDIDTYIDELVESYVDYGLALSKNVNEVRPTIVPLQQIAFCDQTDILSGALGLRHEYGVSDLLDMKGKWYDDAIEDTIVLSKAEKVVTASTGTPTKTPSKYIEVFEVHGTFPDYWLNGEGYSSEDPDKYTDQLHIITYYKDKDGNKQGITLFCGPEKGGIRKLFKAIKRDSIFGRACGRGGIEELFHPQMWTNYDEIQAQQMLEAASLLILQTADKSFESKNKSIKDLAKGEILYHEENKPISQVSITPQNKAMFDEATDRWERNARTVGSADEAQLGKSPNSGTPFRLQALVVQEGRGIHDYRRGKIATHLGEVYRDWVLPYLVKDLNAGKRFVEDLSVEELQEIADKIVTKRGNARIKELVLKGKTPTEQEMARFKDMARQEFMKGGTRRFLEIIKDELKDLPIDVEMNIAGKQADLAERADKLTNIFRQIFANPQILMMPGMGKLFNEIIESSGFSPVDFSSFTSAARAPAPAQPAQGALPSPMAPAAPTDAAAITA